MATEEIAKGQQRSLGTMDAMDAMDQWNAPWCHGGK